MFTDHTTSVSRRTRRLVALLGGAALVVSACGGSPASSGATPSGSVGAPTSPTVSSASPSPSDAGYTGPAAKISYSIWGDPAEIKSQQAVVDAFHTVNPSITVNVTVSDWDTYWDKLQTGIAGGDAPDVFAMDGPLFPDYQSRGVLLDLKPFIEIDTAVAKGEPSFDRRTKQQRRHHCDEQCDEVLDEQGAARTGHGSDVR